MTASPRSVAWSPISGSLDQVFKCEKPGQHISPHRAAGRSTDQHLLGHLRTRCADHFELTLNLLWSNCLLHDHGAASAMHLRYCLPGS
jgi:hypothetical protein